MAIAALTYPRMLNGLVSATAVRRFDWVGDTFKAILTTSSWTPAQTTDDFYNDITNELTTANGYTAGGATLGTKSISQSSLEIRIIAATTTWTSSGTLTANKSAVYKDDGVASSSSPLVMYVTFGADNTAGSGSTFNLVWDATNGLFKLVSS